MNKVTKGLCTEDSEGDGREEWMMSRKKSGCCRWPKGRKLHLEGAFLSFQKQGATICSRQQPFGLRFNNP